MPVPGGAATLALAVPALLLGVAGARPPSAAAESVRARWLMGTVLEVRLPASAADPAGLAEAVYAEVARVEAAASLWRPGTELARVHEQAARGEAALVSETLGSLVAEALRAAEVTDGTFSPAVGALVGSYDLRGEGRWPDAAERRRSASLARPGGVHYDPATRALRLEEGVRLDLDGIAKGFALDRAAAALRARGVDDALLNFGGQLLAIGPPADRPPRDVLVVAPDDPSVRVLSVRLRDASLSTSSNSERRRRVAGREAGHLLDPRSGELVAFRGSASVLAESGALADALSTAWAVEGPAAFRDSDSGSRLRRAGAVAFVIPRSGGGYETLADAPFETISSRDAVARARPHSP